MKKIQTAIRNKFCRLAVVAFVWGVILLTASAQFKPTLSNSVPAAPRRDVSRSILPPPTITVFPTGSSDSGEGGRPRVIYVQGEDLWTWDVGQ